MMEGEAERGQDSCRVQKFRHNGKVASECSCLLSALDHGCE